MACGSLRPGGWGRFGWGTRGCRARWSPARPLGEAAERDLSGPGASAGGRHAGHGGVLAVPVVRGLPGVGPTPVPPGATVLVCRTVGAAPWGPRELWLAHGLWSVRLPAGPGSACALLTAIHVWAHRSGWRGEPTNGRPLVAVAGRDTTWQRPCGRDDPTRSLGQQVCSRSLTEGLPDCPQVFPAHPGAGNAPRLHQPGRAGLARPRPVTRPPPHLARQPQEGNSYTREGLNDKPRDEPHKPRDLLHPPGSPGPRSRTSATPTTSSAPTAPSGTAHPHPKPPRPPPPGP